MKQTKWLINLSVLLALIAITVGAKNLSPSRVALQDDTALPDTLAVSDTVALPFASYKMGAAIDSVLLSEADSCVSDYAPLHNFLRHSILCVQGKIQSSRLFS